MKVTYKYPYAWNRHWFHNRQSCTVKSGFHIVFSDYERHYANIGNSGGTFKKAREITGPIQVIPVITGSGGLTLSSHLEVPFVQEVVAVASALQDFAPQTDVAIELGGEDAKLFISPEASTRE